MPTNVRTAKEIYESYCAGESLSDADLIVGLAHFKHLAGLLYASGPVFALAAREANRMCISLESYVESRHTQGGEEATS